MTVLALTSLYAGSAGLTPLPAQALPAVVRVLSGEPPGAVGEESPGRGPYPRAPRPAPRAPPPAYPDLPPVPALAADIRLTLIPV